jgi:hypothetical protein
LRQHLAAAALYLVNDSLFGDGAYIYSQSESSIFASFSMSFFFEMQLP